MQHCSTCQKDWPLESFQFIKHKKPVTSSSCRDCRHAELKARLHENTKRWRRLNPEKAAAHSAKLIAKRRSAVEPDGIRRLHNLRPVDYAKMLEAQGGKCAICRGANKSKKRLSVDRCGVQDRFRGLLCVRCKMMVGFIENDAVQFFKVRDYLIKHESPNSVML